MIRKHKIDNNDKEVFDGTVEAGQMLGMPPETVLNTYFNKPNDLLQLLRVYSGLSLPDMAKKLEISDYELEHYENSNELIPFQLLPKIAKLFNLNLKTLLLLLGHAKTDSDTSKEQRLCIAAQYAGDDLSEQEKTNLDELFKTIIETINDRKME